MLRGRRGSKRAMMDGRVLGVPKWFVVVSLIVLSLAVILSGALFVQSASWVSTFNDGLMGFWTFNETEGFAVPDVYGGYANSTMNFTVGGSYVNWTSGGSAMIGNAMSFDGNQWLNMSVRYFGSGADPFSISFWIYDTATAVDSRIMSQIGGDTALDVFKSSANRYSFNMVAPSPNSKTAYFSLFPQKWTHVVLVMNGTDLNTYVNGTLNGTASLDGGTPYRTNASWKIANMGEVYIGKFIMDELSLYNRSLNATEILDLYNNGTGLTLGQKPLNNVPSVPVFDAPANGSNLYTSVFFANWSNSTDADGDIRTYDFQLSNDSGFSHLIINNGSVSETTNTTGVAISGLVDDGFYFMRVRSDDALNMSAWSVIRGFNLWVQPNVSLNLPVDRGNVSVGNVTFNCSSVAVSGGGLLDNLTLVVDGVANFTVGGAGDSLSLEVEANLTDGWHNWTCDAFDSNGFNRTAVAGSFLVDNVAPVTSISGWYTGEPTREYAFSGTADDAVSFNLSCSDAGGSGCWNTYHCVDTGNSCTPTNTTNSEIVSIDGDGTFYVRYFSQDILSNNNTVTSKTVVVDSSLPSPTTLGGGGGGAKKDNLSWSMANKAGGGSYGIIMLPGGVESRELRFVNFDDKVVSVKIGCVDVQGSSRICPFVTLGNSSLSLRPSELISVVTSFTVSLPDDWVKGVYDFRLVASDQNGNQRSVSVQVDNDLNVLEFFFAKLQGSRRVVLWRDFFVPNLILAMLAGFGVFVFSRFVIFRGLLHKLSFSFLLSVFVAFAVIILV